MLDRKPQILHQWRFIHGLLRDFILGSATVLLAALAICLYVHGTREAAGIGWFVAAAAIAGGAIAEWSKFGLTGRHLTLWEAAQDLFISGLLAFSASPMILLQRPAEWSEIFLLSRTMAAVIIAFYHAINLYCLSVSGKHLEIISGALIILPPYLVNLLLLLESPLLLHQLGNSVSAGWLSDWRLVSESLGRLVIIFIFNEMAVNGLSLVAKRTGMKSLKVHGSLLLISLAVVAGPWIAQLGSGSLIAAWPPIARFFAVIATTIFSQAGLWAEVYLITGVIMELLHGKSPSPSSIAGISLQGMKKGMIYSGVFMGILQGLGLLGKIPAAASLAADYPLAIAALLGTAAFPLIKTIIESFDGSQAFFRRVGMSYKNPVLYCRGLVVGLGLGYAILQALSHKETLVRVEFGCAVGIAAFAGISFLRDGINAIRHRGRLCWRVYLVEMIWGGLIGAAIGFYLDAAQVTIVMEKFHRYLSMGHAAEPFGIYPFLSKWGFIELGSVSGGVSLLYNEALAGVICWSIPAWLFAVNRTFLTAYFRKEAAPIKALFTRDGLIGVSQNMLEVLRWGLWMSPIINSFLRPMGEPTWYNQDGALHSAIAIFRDATTSPESFRAWSLHVFVLLLAYDAMRILIWLDHMGLRVATLVNLSFLGMDKLDGRVARFLGSAATAQCIPDSVKRFATWAPLLIPYYIPRGQDWDYAWSQSEALQNSAGQSGIFSSLAALPWVGQALLAGGSILVLTAIFALARSNRRRAAAHSSIVLHLRNSKYAVMLGSRGDVVSQALESGYDLSRRSYDYLDPAGRALFLIDASCEPGESARSWPVIGNFPRRYGPVPQIESRPDTLVIRHLSHGINATIEISLPGENDPVELWTLTLENATNANRHIKAVPYLEWVLNRPDADRNHTQYNRLFAEMEYLPEARAILAWDKHSKTLGILAADRAPEGFLTSRIDFIGRARSLWTPRALETLHFSPAEHTAPHPTFDPLGSLVVGMTLKAGQSALVRFLMGMTNDKRHAVELIAKHLGNSCPKTSSASSASKPQSLHAIRHGEIPPGTPQPYWSFLDNGRTMLVRTPFTPRPFDHTLSNALGHVVSVTNRGLHTTSNGNSQQNLLTPNWPDIVTREMPGEAIYLYDLDDRRWYSPTYHPLNDAKAHYQVEFSVEGTATYRMTHGALATELTIFVPPDAPLGIYRLTIKNGGDTVRRIRVAPYFQMVLSNQPENAGPLKVDYDRSLAALFFENPRNVYRTGPAFVAMSPLAEQVQTHRGRFFGPDRDVAHPFQVERGEPAQEPREDDRPIAGLLTTLEIPAHGECTVAVMLGQADDRKQAAAIIRAYQNPAFVQASLAETKKWWRRTMHTVRVKSNQPAFDHYLHWLKYQTLAERIWARRGFYQASGAFGYRDQLQDAVNLIWMEPELARRQIVLHASQQFFEGDVLQWFHQLQDGRTAFAARNYASDPHLWLAWAVAEYIAATGDESILDEQTPYLETSYPLEPLPAGKHGMAFVPHRSSRTDTVYRHCMKAIDLVLDRRMGKRGLPLMCAGDWNDGLDEIGSQGKGESVWLGFFLHYILHQMSGIIEKKEGARRKERYAARTEKLKEALENTWRGDRYLRAIHDDGTEIGISGSGVWEIDALSSAWAVISGMNAPRAKIAFDTALGILEKEKTILLGWPALREDTTPYLGRSSGYPEGVRENGMYCHGVQWLVGAARILAERLQGEGNFEEARKYRETAYRLWLKISPLAHVTPEEIETYGGQPNKQAADILTAYDLGRMIWNGYTGAAGWLFRQALEGIMGARLDRNEMILPDDFSEPRGDLTFDDIERDVSASPIAESQDSRTTGRIADPAGNHSLRFVSHGRTRFSQSTHIEKG
jgi:cyclic beta-1,2-glucan synthetase